MKKLILVILSLYALSNIPLLQSCTKEPETITQFILQTDTLTIVQHDTITIQLTDTINLTSFIEDTVTTYILIRHAETQGGGSNPILSTIGKQRAETLADNLQSVNLSAIYSTNYNRTKLTAEPISEAKNLDIDIYNPSVLISLKNEVSNLYQGEVVLIVGHSNTTPDLINLLTNTNTYQTLEESEYNNLYIVSVSLDNTAKVLHLKYGE